MSTSYPVPERPFIQTNPGVASQPRSSTPGSRATGGAKRGRKPKAAGSISSTNSPRPPALSPLPGSSQGTEFQWNNLPATAFASSSNGGASAAGQQRRSPSQPQPAVASESGVTLSLPGAEAASAVPRPPGVAVPGEEDGEGEDDHEMLPAMADDDYSAQLSFQSQSKDNLKVLMDNLSPEQYDRFEAYRRHALPKQAVRKVIQQTLGQQASMPVAQIVAGFGKVFVGEIVEKARVVQQRRGETGPLSPDHLREAYRMYQQETGRVGAARPLRAKRTFVR
ncbi:hTAFII28-like protein conserved region-domain-containing protein [Fomitopsis serialis]|uniref:hTAFII28-like protein conserved region-domain-containing protein n=1 Tax=Fomitopsis serialis TaxID=139415 RepID=UPI0020088E68|nr:hTAFII28-like protein conserved region-domain-containing protein [Neoantrodia serialis]KAH9927635.1 hTAFII28-like protein conserved region-domain-containing protein [Neoantrodia serialis]